MKPLTPSTPTLLWTPRRRTLWQISFLSTALLAVVLTTILQLRTPETPGGILEYEFVWTPERAQEMVNAWETRGLIARAWGSLLVDYGFMIAYSSVMALSTIRIGPSLVSSKKHLASWVSLPVVAGILDAVENAGLMAPLLGSFNPIPLKVAGVCATVKFLLVTVSLLFLGVCSVKISFAKAMEPMNHET